MLASAIPQTFLSRVDFSPKCLLLLLMTVMDEGAAGREKPVEMPVALPLRDGHTRIVGLAAPSEACIWIPLRKAGGTTAGWAGAGVSS